MNKKIWIVLLLCLTVYGVFAEGEDNVSADTEKNNQTGIVRKVTGKVQLKTAGSSNFVKAKVGDEVMQNTIVSTGLKSTVIIAVGDTVFTIGPVNVLSLAEIQSNAEKNEGIVVSGKLSCCP